MGQMENSSWKKKAPVYLSVGGNDDLSQVVVHWRHGLAHAVQSHVHLPLHPVAVGQQTHQLHYNLRARDQAQHIVIQHYS